MGIRNDILIYGKMAQRQLGYIAGQIEVTSACFQDCKYCKSRTTGKYHGHFRLQHLENFVDELCTEFPMFEHLTLTGGDPQAWPDLDEFLDWWNIPQVLDRVNLQISTALARNINQPALWRTAIKDLRVSIDADSDDLYQEMRGDKKNTCNTILARLVVLKHPNLAIITTAYPENINELLPLIFSLDNLYRKGLPLRKIIVMVGIGVELNEEFWSSWRHTKQWAMYNLQVPTSFADDILDLRTQCNSAAVDNVHCWASKLGFHIKPNGDVYPCCLVGGEALGIQKEFLMGNIFKQDIIDIYNSYTPTKYAMKPICREICQFKQFQINQAGEYASQIKLAIP